jgi:outer membrane lipoprotein-sorting protein
MKLAAAVLAVFSLGLAGTASAQTVDEIVEKNLKAKGGLDILRATNSVRMTAKVNDQMPMTILAKRPNLFRREVVMGGQSIVQASDGSVLWMQQPGMPAAKVPNPPAALKSEGEFDGVFVDYKARGTTIALVGKEPVEGTDTYHLKVTTKEGAVQDIYLDAETGLERKIVISIQQGGQTLTQEQMPSDYRDVEGRKMPFRIKNVLGTSTVEIVVEKVEFNVPIDDAVFKLPK